MAALRRLPVESGIAAMQSINVTVLNPLFFAVSGRPACRSLRRLRRCSNGPNPAPFISLPAACYLVGTIFVTMVFNVPLNNKLAAVTICHPGPTWNHLRTGASPCRGPCLFWPCRPGDNQLPNRLDRASESRKVEAILLHLRAS